MGLYGAFVITKRGFLEPTLENENTKMVRQNRTCRSVSDLGGRDDTEYTGSVGVI